MATTEVFFASFYGGGAGAPNGTVTRPYTTLEASVLNATLTIAGGDEIIFYGALGSVFSPTNLIRASNQNGVVRFKTFVMAGAPNTDRPEIQPMSQNATALTWEEISPVALDSASPVKTLLAGSHVWRATATPSGMNALYPDGSFGRLSNQNFQGVSKGQRYPDATYTVTDIIGGIGGKAYYANPGPPPDDFYKRNYSGGDSNPDRFMYFVNHGGQVEVNGWSFRYAQRAIVMANGSGIKPGMLVTNCLFRDLDYGFYSFGSGYANPGIGFTGTKVINNIFINIGSTAIMNMAGVQNKMLVRGNILRGICRAMSLGAIYNNSFTTDGSRIILEWNDIDDVFCQASLAWPIDGFALYGEYTNRNLEIRYNFVRRTRQPIIVSDSHGFTSVHNNWIDGRGIAQTPDAAIHHLDGGGLLYDFNQSNTPSAGMTWPLNDFGESGKITRVPSRPHAMHIYNNISRGFNVMIFDNFYWSASFYKISPHYIDNISEGNGTSQVAFYGDRSPIRIVKGQGGSSASMHSPSTRPDQRHVIRGNCFTNHQSLTVSELTQSGGITTSTNSDWTAIAKEQRSTTNLAAFFAKCWPTMGAGQDIDPAAPEFNSTNYAFKYVRRLKWLPGDVPTLSMPF